MTNTLINKSSYPDDIINNLPMSFYAFQNKAIRLRIYLTIEDGLVCVRDVPSKECEWFYY